VTSLSAVIEALASPLGPHPKSDLETNLYSGSTPITIMDESNHQISFNRLKKSMTSLLAVIGASGSPLGPHAESDLKTDLYSDSTLIAIKTSLNAVSVSDDFKKATTSLQEVTKSKGSTLGSPKKDLATDLYSGSSLTVDYDEMGSSDFSNLFRSLNT
jgi:hypothetical protein